MRFDLETWAERAAIYEHDGGIPRVIADRWAMRLFLDDPQADESRRRAVAERRKNKPVKVSDC